MRPGWSGHGASEEDLLSCLLHLRFSVGGGSFFIRREIFDSHTSFGPEMTRAQVNL